VENGAEIEHCIRKEPESQSSGQGAAGAESDPLEGVEEFNVTGSNYDRLAKGAPTLIEFFHM